MRLINLDARPHDRQKYLRSLIQQDWSSVYPCDTDSGDYYVYAHVDPHGKIFSTKDILGGNFKGMPFYIGKGTGNRAYDLKRNQGHGKKIREVLDAGWNGEDIVHIIFSGLSEQKALEIETKFIYFFGTIYEKGRNGVLYNLDLSKRPTFSGDMQKLPTRQSFENLKASKNEIPT